MGSGACPFSAAAVSASFLGFSELRSFAQLRSRRVTLTHAEVRLRTRGESGGALGHRFPAGPRALEGPTRAVRVPSTADGGSPSSLQLCSSLRRYLTDSEQYPNLMRDLGRGSAAIPPRMLV